ncbi:MAG: EamA family transporter, partial [Anaerolineae bacterium]
MKKSSPHVTAVLQALLVTFLWSTSWVLIKIGLADMPPVTFAGMRFFLAFLVLLPFYRRSEQATPLRALSVADWRDLLGLGLLYYAITQGSMFVALVYL